jgi:hypothetical protein
MHLMYYTKSEEVHDKWNEEGAVHVLLITLPVSMIAAFYLSGKYRILGTATPGVKHHVISDCYQV